MNKFIPQMEPWFDKEENILFVSILMKAVGLRNSSGHNCSKKIADYTGAKYCIVVNNGTISLTLLRLHVVLNW